MAPSTPLSLADAISAVEQTNNNYAKAVQQTSSDQALADDAQRKADAAKAVVVDDQQKQTTAAQQFNGALRGAIAAFEAALIPGVDPPTPQP